MKTPNGIFVVLDDQDTFSGLDGSTVIINDGDELAEEVERIQDLKDWKLYNLNSPSDLRALADELELLEKKED